MKFLKENTNTLTDKLDLSDNLKSFLVSSDFKKMLNSYNIDNIYRYTSSDSFSNKDIRNLTQILYSIDVNPLNYLTYVPSYFLSYVDSTINISIPNNIKNISEGAFYNCRGLVGISIPDSVTTIGRRAFEKCIKLTKIVIPDSVTSIGYEAFSSCVSLMDITLGNGVTSIDDYAFEYCSSLKNITIPNNVTSIGDCVFAYCSDLYAITINSNITKINYGFAKVCENLTKVSIPKTVLTIDNYSFSDCPSLREIQYNGTKQEWRKIEKHGAWKTASPIQTIHCIDGDINYKVV